MTVFPLANINFHCVKNWVQEDLFFKLLKCLFKLISLGIFKLVKEILCVQFLSLDWIRNWILVLLNQDGRVNRLVLFVSKQIRDICMHIKLCKNYQHTVFHEFSVRDKWLTKKCLIWQKRLIKNRLDYDAFYSSYTVNAVIVTMIVN